MRMDLICVDAVGINTDKKADRSEAAYDGDQ